VVGWFGGDGCSGKEVNTGAACGDGGDGVAGGVISGGAGAGFGGDSVVKALTALQELWVSGLNALTFQ